MEFEIDDLVNVDDLIERVTGVIHDDERLFITPIIGGKEHEVAFNEVKDVWRKIKLSDNSDYAKCPVCGESWNMKEHESCQCGAYIKKRS